MCRSGTGSQGVRCTLHVEGLEDRTVPAGGVSAMVFDGVLYLAGDGAANMISVTAESNNVVRIRALDGATAINGVVPPANGVRVGGVKNGVHAVLNGGDDALIVSNTNGRGGLNVDMGDGNDTLMVLSAGHRGETILRGGTGDDTVELRVGDYRKDVRIDTGAGNDQVNINAVRGRATARLINGGGTDFISGRNFTFKRFLQNGFVAGTQPPPVAPVDSTQPTVTLTSSTAGATNGPVNYTATFSEDVTGFGAGGIAVANGTITSFTQADARTYNFTVTPTAQGAVTAQVTAGSAFDPAGNPNVASDPVSRTFDTAAPAAPTFNLAAASDSGTAGDLRTDMTNVSLTGTAEANSTVALLRATSGTAPGTGQVVATTTAGANGAFTFNVGLNLGPNSLVVRATDAAGNVSTTFGQTFTRNAAPVGTAQTRNLTVAGGPSALDLTTAFTDAERIVRFTVAYPNGQTGSIDINLFANSAPATVANFLQYVNSASAAGNYNGALFHRLVNNFVLQGGGFKFDDPNNTFPEITDLAPVNNEPGVSNTRGTIAMAKMGGNPNSATNEFFFNLGDNSANLDVQNGGFTVFAQVMNGGQGVVDAISTLGTTSVAGVPGGGPLPIRTGANTTSFPQNITAADLATITNAGELTAAQRLTFSVVSNSNAAAATATVNGSSLNITPVAGGTTTITVRATDLDGSFTDTTVTVNVTA